MFFYIPVKTESFLQSSGGLGIEDYTKFPNISPYFSVGLVGTGLHSSLEATSPNTILQ